MEDGGCGFARARGCRESVFCVLGVCLNVLPFSWVHCVLSVILDMLG